MAAFILIFHITVVSADDYEVTIDGQIYMLTRGISQEIRLGDGRRIAVCVRDAATKSFQEQGISFVYPAEMKLSQDSIYGIKQIMLATTDSTLMMIQIFPSGTTPSGVQKDLLNGFRDEYSNLGARFPTKSSIPCVRKLNGIDTQGVELSFSLGPLAHKTEIYTMLKDGKVLALVFQYAEEDKEFAIPRFEIVSSSFK